MTLVEVVRSGFVESRHRGAVAVVDDSGRALAGAGDVTRPFFIRSTAKPVQATILHGLGAVMPDEHLAVAASSHDGHPVHVAIVERMLADGGLGPGDLACPPAWPLGDDAARAVLRRGALEPRRIWHDCSGKHAAMLRACVAQGWPTEGYLDPGHPVQQAIRTGLERSFGTAATWGVDGCGAPVVSADALTLARAFVPLVDGGGPVAAAMRRFPALVGGTGAVDHAVMLSLPAVAKRGAEASLGFAVAGRGAVAIKVWDGGIRALGPITAEVVRQLGWADRYPAAELEWRTAVPVLGGGEVVGTVRPAFRLEPL